MKILVADDVPDIVEVLALMVQGAYPDSQILEALDGKAAIDLIDQHPDIQLVLSDYNMPEKSGGEVFTYLRQVKKSFIPFILVSTVRPFEKPEFKDDLNIHSLTKPFTDENLQSVLRSLEKSKQIDAEALGIPAENAYVPIHIEALRKIRRIESPLFLKLSEQNYVKVLHPGSEFDQAEYDRFSRKGTERLWIEFFNYSSFILVYKKEILSREAWKELADVDAANSLSLDHSVIMGAGKSFGWSDSTVELAVSNIRQVTHLLERNPDLKEVVERLAREKHSRVSSLSVLLAVACTAIVQELGWGSESTRQKLVFAALLHDMELDEDLFTTMMTLLQQSEVAEFMQDPSAKVILDHPIKTAEMLVHWPLCPPDVDVIIRQHHERPDGKGFPFGLEAMKISALAAVLIVAEDMIFHTVDNLGGDPKAYLESRREFYSRGEFKKVHEAALRSMRKS